MTKSIAKNKAHAEVAAPTASLATQDTDGPAKSVSVSQEDTKDKEVKVTKKAHLDRKFYRVKLGYPLYHPYQNRLVPTSDGSLAPELDVDGWVETQVAAGLLREVADANAA